MLLRFFLAGLIFAGFVGCDHGSSAGDPDAGDFPFTIVLPPLPQVITLQYGEEYDLFVTVLDSDEHPVRGANVSFLLERSFHDTGLSAVTDVTDSQGQARTRILAGYTSAVFQIRVSTSHARTVTHLAAVGASGFGTLSVAPVYEGQRSLDGVEIQVYLDETCTSDRVVEGTEGDRSAVVAPEGEDVQFESLPSGVDYAIVASGLNEDTVLARGCIDGAMVATDDTVHYEVELLNLPIRPAGHYDAELHVILGEFSLTLADAGRASALARIATHGTGATADAAMLLDALEDALEEFGPPDSAEALRTEREGGLDGALQAELDAADVGPTIAVDVVSDEIEALLSSFGVRGEVEIDPSAPASARFVFLPEAFAFTVEGDGDGDEDEPVLVDFDDLEILPFTLATATFDSSDESAYLEMILSLPFTDLGRGAMRGGVVIAEHDTVPTWLGVPAGCFTLAANATVLDLTSGCSNCLPAACVATIESLEEALLEGYDSIDLYSWLHSEGTLQFFDSDDDLIVNGFESEDLVCTFEVTSDGDDLPVEGSFSGARTTPPTP